MRALPLALILLGLAPVALCAATVEGSRSLVVSEPVSDNAYLYGGDLTVTAPITGDLAALGGTLSVAAPVSGDALLGGGTVEVKKPITGDARVVGARIHMEDLIGGDLMAAGGSVVVDSVPAFAWIVGEKVWMNKGATGPVTIYGSDVNLAGMYGGDVHVVASDALTLAEGTVIHGTLHYDAPQQADIPTSAVVAGGVSYTGKSFLPTTQEAQTFAIAGATIFFFVRILAVVIAAGLITGLFPSFAQAVADQTLGRSPKRFVLLTLLGFGVIVATPVFFLLLLASFAGAAVAFILIAAYALLLLLSYMYAAVIAGSALARTILKRPFVYWRDGVFGMLALSIITLIPVLGWLVALVLFAAATGTIVTLFYRYVFPKDIDITLE
jgi:hypothetical protein